MKRPPFRVFLLFPLLLAAMPAAAAPVFDWQEERQPVASGIDVIRIRQFDEQGWLNVSALEIDLGNPLVRIGALHATDRITSREPVSTIAERHGAFAAVNADFFYIGQTDAPVGIHVQEGGLVKTPDARHTLAVGTLPNGEPFIHRIRFEGTIESSGESFPLAAVNSPVTFSDAVVYYDTGWGTAPPITDDGNPVYLTVDANGKITGLHSEGDTPQIPRDGFVLLGTGAGASWLERYARQDAALSVSISIQPPAVEAVGGNIRLLRNGEIVPDPGGPRHPRTAAGFSADRKTLWLAVIDGRSSISRGVTNRETAEWMRRFGAHEALNLDGGGSSALVARLPGRFETTVFNVPSDGSERRVPNALAVFMDASPSRITQLHIHPPAPDESYPISRDELRLAPGATLIVTAGATDRNLNPVAIDSADLDWSVVPPGLGEFFATGAFRGSRPGAGTLTASLRDGDRTVSASFPVRVIGKPILLKIDPPEIAVQPGEQTAIRIFAADADGYRAALNADEVEWEIRGDVGKMDNGVFTAGGRTAAGALIARFRDSAGAVLAGVGGEPVPVATFDDSGAWRAERSPSEISAQLAIEDDPAILRAGRKVARLDYDFRGPTVTRAAYVRSRPSGLPLPRRTLKLGLWVYGDASEAWLRARIVDRAGIARPIDFARRVDWTGWRYVEADIPPGMDAPLALHSIYLVETREDARQHGAVYFDSLHAIDAPEPDTAVLDELPRFRDAANRPASEAGTPFFRFAVFGDSKVQAALPDSLETRILRRSIDRINDEPGLAFALFTGDLVENDSEENYRFGKDLLDVLNIPRHTVVANHEIAGTGSFDRFHEHFGPTFFSFVHENSRFLFLNAARPGLRISEPEQWPWLREELEKAGENEHLFVTLHTPLIDPLPGAGTAWTDPLEAGLFQSLMTRRREAGGNVFVFQGHVHGFHSRLHDGVRYLTTAGSGSPLYLPPEHGGFFHYLIVTVAGREVTYRVVPLLDRIDAPESVRVEAGKSVPIPMTGIGFEDSVRFPLRYPAAIDWRLTGDPVGRFDPDTGVFHAKSAGRALLEIASGNSTAKIKIQAAAPSESSQ